MYEIGTVDPGGRTRRFHHFKFSGGEIGSTQRSKNAYLPGLPLYGYKISADEKAQTVDNTVDMIRQKFMNVNQETMLVASNDNDQENSDVGFGHIAIAA